jgi:hypothetical protein
MANNNANNVGIKNSWSLMAFARSHGKMQVAPFVNKETGEEFKSCVFTNPDDQSRCFVSFSSNLGELTPQDIVSRKDNLQVVELESGTFKLCNVGANNWEDVDLF